MALTRLNNRSVSAVTALPSGIDIPAGAIVKADLPIGSILQTISVVDSSVLAITSGSDTTILTANITPSFSSSKILVIVSLSIAKSDGYTAYTKLKRNGTWIYPNTSDRGFPIRNTMTEWGIEMPTFNYLDSPNTTSQISYTITTLTSATWNGAGSSYPTYVNRNRSGTQDSWSGGTSSSSITLLEIAG
jgi:hypothetical protein